MRKIVLLFFGAITFIACSEEAVSVSENQNVVRREGVNIESLYLSMISSESYIMAEEALSHFITKMNFDGNVSDIDTEARMFSWISANLSMTTFSDLSEAEAHWQEVQNLGYISVQENIGFYEAINERENDFRDLILEFDPIIPQVSNNGSCIDAFKDCVKGAAQIYQDEIKQHRTYYLQGQVGLAEFSFRIALTRNFFINNVNGCAESFEICVTN